MSGRDEIYYEWVCEELDSDGDIIDPLFGDTYKDALLYKSQCDTDRVEIALVQFIGNQDEGIISRQYAYIKDGALPAEFEDGYKVPQRFHRELNRG